MSFEAYLNNIRAKTGCTPADFKRQMEAAGQFRRDLKAKDLVAWLQAHHGLGHGHSMAVWAVFTEENWVDAPPMRNSRKQP